MGVQGWKGVMNLPTLPTTKKKVVIMMILGEGDEMPLALRQPPFPRARRPWLASRAAEIPVKEGIP
jgi:hypothetical protein